MKTLELCYTWLNNDEEKKRIAKELIAMGCKDDEIFIGNTQENKFPANHLKSLKTLRLGNHAYDITGNLLSKEEGYKPLIIHVSEFEQYNKIMQSRMNN